jgi:hypothetical protein
MALLLSLVLVDISPGTDPENFDDSVLLVEVE